MNEPGAVVHHRRRWPQASHKCLHMIRMGLFESTCGVLPYPNGGRPFVRGWRGWFAVGSSYDVVVSGLGAVNHVSRHRFRVVHASMSTRTSVHPPSLVHDADRPAHFIALVVTTGLSDTAERPCPVRASLSR